MVVRIEDLVAQARVDLGGLDDETLERDLLHATALAGLFRDRFRWATHLGKWMEYSGGVWQPTTEERVARLAAAELRTEYASRLALANDRAGVRRWAQAARETCSATRINGALYFLRGWDGVLTGPAEWDSSPWLLNVKNGTLDLRSGELRPHRPGDLLTKQAPVAYNPQARGMKWQAHLERFLPNPNIRRQVQRDLGMALTGAVLDEILPIWYGTGGNGKSTTIRTVMGILGDYACKAAPGLLVQHKFERSTTTDIADLAGRRLVFSVETEDNQRLAEALVKDLTGGDEKKARFLYKDNFTFKQTFTIFLATNHRPVITGVDWAMWRRVRLVPWEVQIPEGERRPQDEVVAELVTEEGSAILNGLLAGLKDWQGDHHWVAPEVQAATEAYRAEQDVLGAFLGECCELGVRYTVAANTLYERYTAWCERVGEEAVSKNRFGRLLRHRGLGQEREAGTGNRLWRGVRLV